LGRPFRSNGFKNQIDPSQKNKESLISTPFMIPFDAPYSSTNSSPAYNSSASSCIMNADSFPSAVSPKLNLGPAPLGKSAGV
jgi:hypothetical protein